MEYCGLPNHRSTLGKALDLSGLAHPKFLELLALVKAPATLSWSRLVPGHQATGLLALPGALSAPRTLAILPVAACAISPYWQALTP